MPQAMSDKSGAWLNAQLQELGLNFSEAGRLFGVSDAAIHDWCKKVTIPKYVERLAIGAKLEAGEEKKQDRESLENHILDGIGKLNDADLSVVWQVVRALKFEKHREEIARLVG